MTSLKLIYFALFIVQNAYETHTAVSDKRLCANPDCSEIIATAKSILNYSAMEKGMLSFPRNADLQIYSKSAGKNMGVWGASYNGKRGYVPVGHLREQRTIVKNPHFLVDTEFADPQEVPSLQNVIFDPEELKPSTVVDDQNIVIDGTTIPVNPSATQMPMPVTNVPSSFYDSAPESSKVLQTDIPVMYAATEAPESLEAASNEIPKEQEQQEQIEKSDEEKKSEAEVETVKEEDKFLEDFRVEEKPLEDSKIEEKPVEDFKMEEKPLEDIKIEEEPVEDIKIEEKPLEDFKIEEKPVEDFKIEEKPVEDFKIEEKPTVEIKPDEVEVKPEDFDFKYITDKPLDNLEDSKVEYITEKPVEEIKFENALNTDDTFNGTLTDDNEDKLSEDDGKLTMPEAIAEQVNLPEENNVKDMSAENVDFKEDVLLEKPAGDYFKMNLPVEEDVKVEGEVDEVLTENVLALSDDLKVNLVAEDDVTASLEEKLPASEDVAVEEDAPSLTMNMLNSGWNYLKEASSNYGEVKDSDVVENVDSKESELPKIEEPDDNNNSYEAAQIEDNSWFFSSPKPEEIKPIVDEVKQEEIKTAEDYQQEEIVDKPIMELDPIEEEETSEELLEREESENINSVEEIAESTNVKSPVNEESVEEEVQGSCNANPLLTHCNVDEKPAKEESSFFDWARIGDLIITITVSGLITVIFLWGYMVITNMNKEAPLVAKVNNLEKALQVTKAENQLLTDKVADGISSENQEQLNASYNAVITELEGKLEEICANKNSLEEQVACLEKELENSTELGLELNKMITEVLGSQNKSETLLDNIEQLQKQLVEQQMTINTINANLNEKDTENHELQLELEINNKKVMDLQAELDKMVLNLLKIEEEKEQSQSKYEAEIVELKEIGDKLRESHTAKTGYLNAEIAKLQKSLEETRRNLELKTSEFDLLKKSLKSGDDSKSTLDLNALKAEMKQLQKEKQLLSEHLQRNQEAISSYEKQMDNSMKERQCYKEKYEEADKEKLEALTKLEVLGNYFKEKEAEMQKELNKHESRWSEKQGEAVSTSERIKFMQEELQNYKAQNGTLQQEIVSQEVDLKSQISVLEKKAHESWVSARQAERKLEEAKQEAAQLRNRLTLRERNLNNEDKSQNRLGPLEMNGDHTLSPIHMEAPASPPLLFGGRDLTTSPPLPGMPHFLPPPPGVPFPPMPGVPPFMPPPPNMFPGDHRPPPLGRMSSPPINSRYSPDSRAYSPYDRHTPSPPDSYYSPPHRSYSPYNGRDERDRRDYKKTGNRNSFRNHKGGISSGNSANSNESLENINRNHSKV
ncbi:PREDICTED: transport and Golgi organization protein 1 isoform X2 [Nicrophorus vespilloides]|uniref:Transport and Golgi organization protein 1 isoform X2 n=1 Tax=Nicrophorus vespilloides TaxID=110193 RepID=A0ABM1M171_NICVS|nr:PREDICTED: transport and Golgi organization protein 1 isoform X2 [Nicrophorus vespilloides]